MAVFSGLAGRRNLKLRRVSPTAEANFRALEARPCSAPEWRPRFVSAHDPAYAALMGGHRYFGPVTARVTGHPGVELLCENDDPVAYLYFFFGQDAYESLSVHLFAEFAKDADAVFDVGAYTGLFALLAARANPEAQVFAFEPVPHIAARAVWNAKANGLSNLAVETIAISGEAGERLLTLYGPGAAATGASLAPKAVRDRGAIDVRAETIDDFLTANAPDRQLNLIKIDTEGDEVAAMEGGAAALAAYGPLVISEALGDAAVAAQHVAMARHGYEGGFLDEAARRIIPLASYRGGSIDFSIKPYGYGNLVFWRGDVQRARLKSVAEAFRTALT